MVLTDGKFHPRVHPLVGSRQPRMRRPSLACSQSKPQSQLDYTEAKFSMQHAPTTASECLHWIWRAPYSPTSMFVVPRGAAAGVSVLLSKDFDELSSVKEYVASAEETVTHGDPREYAIPAHESTSVPRTLQETAGPECAHKANDCESIAPDTSSLVPFALHFIPAAFVSGDKLNNRSFELA